MVHYLLTSESMIWGRKEKKKKGWGGEQTKQTTMDIFLKRVTSPQEQPQASPSGCVPQEGIVFIRDDSSMQVIAP